MKTTKPTNRISQRLATVPSSAAVIELRLMVEVRGSHNTELPNFQVELEYLNVVGQSVWRLQVVTTTCDGYIKVAAL